MRVCACAHASQVMFASVCACVRVCVCVCVVWCVCVFMPLYMLVCENYELNSFAFRLVHIFIHDVSSPLDKLRVHHMTAFISVLYPYVKSDN